MCQQQVNQQFANIKSKMHSQSHIQGLTYLSEFIKNLYTQQTFTINHQFQQLQTDDTLFAVVKLLNIQINDTLNHFKHNQKKYDKNYFERHEFLISNSIRKIGQICKVLAEHCKFQGLHKHLAEFKTFDFYRQIQSEKPSSFVDLLKGIFPSMNVHKDNIPLYMPFYEGLTSYGSDIVGNPNWEMSRMNLNIILQRQMQSMNITDQIWYLILTCDKKILNKFEKTSMENVWAHLNYLYVHQTLKPYRMLEDLQNFRSLDNIISEITSLIAQNITSQKDRNIRLLLSLIFYLLSGGQKNLKDVFEMFVQSFNGIIQLYDRKQAKKQQLQTIGLINTQFFQLFRNKKQIHQGQIDQNKGIKLQILDSLSQKSMNNLNTLLDRRIPIRDFLLRIAYPADIVKKGKNYGKPNKEQINQNLQKLIDENDVKILQILTREMQSQDEDYVFPQYSYFQPQFFKKLSSQYLKIYPDKVLEVVGFLPNQQAVWQLLNSQNLSDEEGFIQIRQLLIKNQECYIRAINKKLQITENDYESFIRIWEQYHQFYNLNSQSDIPYYVQADKIRKQKLLNDMLHSFKIDSAFRELVYLPLRRPQNIMRMMKFLIDGLEGSLLNVDEKEKAQLIQKYLALLLEPWFKSEILTVLSEQERTQFWKEWACVYINDQNLVNDLICAHNEQDSEQQRDKLLQNKAQAIQLE